jgi:CBS-domain-containing membrane protein
MPQRIHDVMTSHPVTLPGTASVQEAARTMREQAIGDVIVMENQQICGIVTDRDIVVRTVAEARDPASKQRPRSGTAQTALLVAVSPAGAGMEEYPMPAYVEPSTQFTDLPGAVQKHPRLV